jgi:hypothetical protein
MMKKLCIVFCVCCLFSTTFLMNALAGPVQPKSIETQQINVQCAIPLMFGLFRGISAINSAGESPCGGNSVANAMSDIQSDLLDYQICVIDNSGTTDEAARDELVQEQINVEVVDCLTNAVDVLFCDPDAGLVSLLGLIRNCTPAAPEETPTE